MSHGAFHLLATRRFLPLFITQFLGAANDNVLKNALVILAAFGVGDRSGLRPELLIPAAAGAFILPFFLFSAVAGRLADRMEKSRLIRLVKLGEVAIMALAALGFWLQSVHYLIFVLFLTGVQAAFFGPLKYAILPDHLAEEELLGGNALIEGGTFLAILLGTIAGGVMITQPQGAGMVSGLLMLLAVAGWLASRHIPVAPAAAPDLTLDPNFLRETWRLLAQARRNRPVFLSILGLSWFWLVGSVYLSQFPAFTKSVLGADESVVTFFLALFSIGVGAGSLLCNRLLKGEISARHLPFAAAGLSLFSLDLYLASAPLHHGPGLLGVAGLLSHVSGWRITADLLLVSLCGGIYAVPLYAILQHRSDPASRSQAIAANNVMNALFMVAASLGVIALLTAGLSLPGVFLVLAILNLPVAVYIAGLLPDETLKLLFRLLFRVIYRVELKGWEHYEKLGPRAVIISNHVSFLDAALLAVYLPGKPTFAINTLVANAKWVQPFLKIVEVHPLDPTNPYALKSLAKAVKEGRHCVIFPEGRLTVTGALMKIYEGPAVVADRADAEILPIRASGTHFSRFTRLGEIVPRHWFPKITLTMLPPERLHTPPEARGKERRRILGLSLYDLMTRMMVETAPIRRTLFDTLLETGRHYGQHRVAFQAPTGESLSYGRLALSALTLGRSLAQLTAPGEAVGVLMPTSLGTATLFFALHAHHRVPAMFNFSTGAANMKTARRAAEIKLIVTSRRFVEMAKLEETLRQLAEEARVIYLEDLAAAIPPREKLLGVLRHRFPRLTRLLDPATAPCSPARPEDPAVILFTSGSEGTPKGVVLSHANLLANCHQLHTVLDCSPKDVVFNALPMFHSFGLTGGLLLPLFNGLRTMLYPSPLHYRLIPELVYDCNATLIFGTDAFLAGYGRAAHPYDFYNVRRIYAGAEKVKDETRRLWSDKFGLRILEGYGATETAPALAVNTPMHQRPGSVGRLLPGVIHRLEPVPGIAQGGRLWVKGPNIMRGYVKADLPGVLQPPEEGWYDTGDIVEVDETGFVTIKGRAKRFAKIAGEMVSLAAVEEMVAQVWPGFQHAVVALPDPRKGERLVLLSSAPQAAREALLAQAQANGLAELLVPRVILPVKEIPLLGSGKVDYGAVTRMARENSVPPADEEMEEGTEG
ncbi:MAG: acyl-[ACP]--phospholipid O-acyltransferase [Magnetococcales bacterium]|nr:acyl-[ACP]--phospholipid O-acyltransferase [Magnetococcales bacterium]